MLNAIEMAWSLLKTQVKTKLAHDLPTILQAQGENEEHINMSRAEYRLRALETIVSSSIRCITVEKVRSFYRTCAATSANSFTNAGRLFKIV